MNIVEVVDHPLRKAVLDALVAIPAREATFAALELLTKAPAASLSRAVATLEEHRFVERRPEGRVSYVRLVELTPARAEWARRLCRRAVEAKGYGRRHAPFLARRLRQLHGGIVVNADQVARWLGETSAGSAPEAG